MPTRTLADLMSGSKSRSSSSSIYEPPDFSSGSSSFTTLMTQLAKAQLAQQKAAAAARGGAPSDGGFIDGGSGVNPVGKLPSGWEWLRTASGHWYGAYKRGGGEMQKLLDDLNTRERTAAIDKVSKNHPELKKDLEALPTQSVEKQEQTLAKLRESVSKFSPEDAQLAMRTIIEPAAKQAEKERAAVESDAGVGTVMDYLNMSWKKAKFAGNLVMPRTTEQKMQLGEDYNKDIQSIIENNAYIRNQKKLEAEGADWSDRTFGGTGSVLSNTVGEIAAPIAGDIATVIGAGKVGAAIGSVVPGVGTAIGGAGGALAGLMTRGAAAFNQGRADFISRVMADDRLNPEQKRAAIDGYSEYGEGALNAAIWTALPGAQLRGSVARAGERKALSEMPTVMSDFASRSNAVRAGLAESAMDAAKWNARSLPSRYLRSVGRTGVELEAYNTAGLLGGNAIYNNATGQDDPIAEGLSDSITGTAISALAFGIPGAGRRPLGMAGQKKTKVAGSTDAVAQVDKQLRANAGLSETEAPEAGEALSRKQQAREENQRLRDQKNNISPEARARFGVLEENLKNATKVLNAKEINDADYATAISDAIDHFYAEGGTDAELDAWFASAKLARRTKTNTNIANYQLSKYEQDLISTAKSRRSLESAVAGAMDKSDQAVTAKQGFTESDLNTAAAAVTGEGAKPAATTPSAIAPGAKSTGPDKNATTSAAESNSQKKSGSSYYEAGRMSVSDQIAGSRPVDRKKAVQYADMLVREGKAAEADEFIRGFNDENQTNGIEVLPIAPFEYRDDFGNPIGGSSAKVPSKEGTAGRVPVEGQNAPVEESVAAAEAKSSAGDSAGDSRVEAGGAEAAGAASEAAPVETARGDTGNQGEGAGRPAVQGSGQDKAPEKEAVSEGTSPIEQRADAGSGTGSAAETDAATGAGDRGAAGETVRTDGGAGNDKNAGGNSVADRTVITEKTFARTPEEKAEHVRQQLETAEDIELFLSRVEDFKGNKPTMESLAEAKEGLDTLMELVKDNPSGHYDVKRIKDALSYVKQQLTRLRSIAQKQEAARNKSAFAPDFVIDGETRPEAPAKPEAGGKTVSGTAETSTSVLETPDQTAIMEGNLREASARAAEENARLAERVLEFNRDLDAVLNTKDPTPELLDSLDNYEAELRARASNENTSLDDRKLIQSALDRIAARRADWAAPHAAELAKSIITEANEGATPIVVGEARANKIATEAPKVRRRVTVETPTEKPERVDPFVAARERAIDALTGAEDRLPVADDITDKHRAEADRLLKQDDDIIAKEHLTPEQTSERYAQKLRMVVSAPLESRTNRSSLFGLDSTGIVRLLYIRGLVERIDRLAMRDKGKFSSDIITEVFDKHKDSVTSYSKKLQERVDAAAKPVAPAEPAPEAKAPAKKTRNRSTKKAKEEQAAAPAEQAVEPASTMSADQREMFRAKAAEHRKRLLERRAEERAEQAEASSAEMRIESGKLVDDSPVHEDLADPGSGVAHESGNTLDTATGTVDTLNERGIAAREEAISDDISNGEAYEKYRQSLDSDKGATGRVTFEGNSEIERRIRRQERLRDRSGDTETEDGEPLASWEAALMREQLNADREIERPERRRSYVEDDNLVTDAEGRVMDRADLEAAELEDAEGYLKRSNERDAVMAEAMESGKIAEKISEEKADTDSGEFGEYRAATDSPIDMSNAAIVVRSEHAVLQDIMRKVAATKDFKKAVPKTNRYHKMDDFLSYILDHPEAPNYDSFINHIRRYGEAAHIIRKELSYDTAEDLVNGGYIVITKTTSPSIYDEHFLALVDSLSKGEPLALKPEEIVREMKNCFAK